MRADRGQWPEGRTATLRRLFREGLSDPEIAERLNTTCRAVIGKRDREDLLRAPRVGPRKPCSSATK